MIIAATAATVSGISPHFAQRRVFFKRGSSRIEDHVMAADTSVGLGYRDYALRCSAKLLLPTQTRRIQGQWLQGQGLA
jgi:hypothetical protein